MPSPCSEAFAIHGPAMTVATECKPHDKIETPHGPVSKARCKNCGREREYDTSKFYEYNVTETLEPRNDD